MTTPEERARAVWETWPDVPGPAADFDATMIARIAAAIAAAEREAVERCAKIAENYPDCGCTGFCECYGVASFEKLAARIREARP